MLTGWLAALSDQASKENYAPVATDGMCSTDWPRSLLGEDERHVSTVNADGVALAATQALYQLNQQKEDQIRELTHQVEELKSLVGQLVPARATLIRGN